MESLKPLSKITDPDKRSHAFVKIDYQTASFSNFTIEDFHRRAESISLHAGVPENIRSHFETARNLIIYSWFYYPFNVTAQLTAYITVEFALRVKTGNRKSSFSALLKKAVEAGWITDAGFSHISRKRKALREHNEGLPSEFKIPEMDEVAAYSSRLVESLPSLRNSLAHGSSFLSNGGAGSVRICADLINQLFPKPNAQQPNPIALQK